MNALLSRFVELPSPDQKLISLARNVCKGGPISHARSSALSGRNGVHIVVVADEATVENSAPWANRVLEKLRTECASLKLTMLMPVIDQGVVPLKYNYMSGYLYVFLLVLMGFSLVMYFLHQERIGVVKKWGAEEAESDKQTVEVPNMTESTLPDASRQVAVNEPTTYTPGYLIPKVLVALLGLAIVGIAIGQAWPDLRLLAKGQRTEAVAVAVVVQKPGQPEFSMKTQAELDAKIKEIGNAKDYTWTFYNEFSFEAKDGKEITFRREVGCKLKPSVPLIDENGLPTTVKLLFDPKAPAQTVLPLEYSTWLAPSLLTLLGLITFGLSATLAWFARKPITLSATMSVNLPAT
jgi:hypothetical protein